MLNLRLHHNLKEVIFYGKVFSWGSARNYKFSNFFIVCHNPRNLTLTNWEPASIENNLFNCCWIFSESTVWCCFFLFYNLVLLQKMFERIVFHGNRDPKDMWIVSTNPDLTQQRFFKDLLFKIIQPATEEDVM